MHFTQTYQKPVAFIILLTVASNYLEAQYLSFLRDNVWDRFGAFLLTLILISQGFTQTIMAQNNSPNFQKITTHELFLEIKKDSSWLRECTYEKIPFCVKCTNPKGETLLVPFLGFGSYGYWVKSEESMGELLHELKSSRDNLDPLLDMYSSNKVRNTDNLDEISKAKIRSFCEQIGVSFPPENNEDSYLNEKIGIFLKSNNLENPPLEFSLFLGTLIKARSTKLSWGLRSLPTLQPMYEPVLIQEVVDAPRKELIISKIASDILELEDEQFDVNEHVYFPLEVFLLIN